MTVARPLRIGTRGSLLARTQTQWVADRLRAAGSDVEIEVVSTRGDERHDLPVSRLGGDGVFVRELEQALLEGRIDAAVHSLKDLPTADTKGLVLGCVPVRATAFDAFVGRTAGSLEALPHGAVVGTSSIRRIAQVRRLRPDLVVRPLRGNVDTRLRRLDAGDFDALIVAAAGLERLGLAGRITAVLEPPAFWPAVGQGALAVQMRDHDAAAHAAAAPLEDPGTRAAVTAERRMLAGLAGGCLAPVGAWARFEPGRGLILGGVVFDVDDDTRAVRSLEAEDSSQAAPRPGQADELSRVAEALALGDAVARQLLALGADRVVARARSAGE
ncbi:MAG: hydroxymethylbilane synthase [Planctomycetota bacterium]